MGGGDYAVTIDKDTNMTALATIQTATKRKAPAKTILPKDTAPRAAAPEPTKLAQLIALLRSNGGASIAELTAGLGWLPHTTRAALTGLRKKGHDISKNKVDEVTRYSIAAAASDVQV